MVGWYNIGIAAFAAIGSFLFVRTSRARLEEKRTDLLTTAQGFDNGIISTSTYLIELCLFYLNTDSLQPLLMIAGSNTCTIPPLD